MIGILEHMLQHPEAKDTVGGIQRWWLADEGREHGQDQVHEALEFMARRGWVVENSFGEDTCVYGVSPAGLADGPALIRRMKS
jgi:hypothetical protein